MLAPGFAFTARCSSRATSVGIAAARRNCVRDGMDAFLQLRERLRIQTADIEAEGDLAGNLGQGMLLRVGVKFACRECHVLACGVPFAPELIQRMDEI